MSAELWTAIGSAATAIAVAVAAVQIWLATNQEKTEFEDGVVKEYRELLAQFPAEVLLQHPDADAFADAEMPKFYRYLDLSNEQVFLRQKRRIRKDTWKEWCAGIRANLVRPGYRAAWKTVKEKTSSFAELRCFEECPSLDPKSRAWRKKLQVVEAELARRQGEGTQG